MGQLTPEFLFDVESRMRVLSEREYERLTGNLIWTRMAKEMSSQSKQERLLWLLDTAMIEYGSRLGGEVEFDQILAKDTQFVAKAATAGLKLNRFQLEDHDGGGVQLAAHWARQMGSYAAYWPQKQVLKAIRDGGAASSTAYDGKVFFATDHPNNPFDSAAGDYANDLTGAASGSYPGAVPIGGATTVDVALDNLGKVFAYIQALKMPNGEDPRMLRPAFIMAPPALTPRVQQLTDAKFIAQAAASGGGSADVAAVIRKWGLGEPLEAPELAANFGGSDSTYYIGVEQMGASDLGALTYVNREPFSIVWNGEMTDAQLARANELQWVTRGRNVVGYGHPYLLFRCQAT